MGLLLLQVLLMWTGEAGKELPMLVCVAQAPVGRIDWGNKAGKCLLEFSVSGAKWADDVQSLIDWRQFNPGADLLRYFTRGNCSDPVVSAAVIQRPASALSVI